MQRREVEAHRPPIMFFGSDSRFIDHGVAERHQL
jgi:hypothetical protein